MTGLVISLKIYIKGKDHSKLSRYFINIVRQSNLCHCPSVLRDKESSGQLLALSFLSLQNKHIYVETVQVSQ